MSHLRSVFLALAAALCLSLASWLEPAVIPRSVALPVHGLFTSTHSDQPRPGHPLPGDLHPALAHNRLAPRTLEGWNTVLHYAPPPIQAKAAFLTDLKTGRVLFAQNADARLPMASTTKIMTAAVVLQHALPTDMVTVSPNAANVGESSMGLQAGERVSVLQLLYGMMLNSGNDAAIALAEHVAGSVPRFVGMMNAFAHRLGMRNTRYMTPHGLDTPGHYSSARDLATIAAYAMRDPVFRRIVATSSYHVPASSHTQEHWLQSVNMVIYWYPGIDGVKPGITDAAGDCQVASVTRDGKRVLAVLLNTPDMVHDVRNLLDFGLHDFRWVQSPEYGDDASSSISGGPASNPWAYFIGAGHYVRHRFLDYLNSHGGLNMLGYPRTEQLREGNRRVQYFEGGELAFDPKRRSVHPVAIGLQEARILAKRQAGPAQVDGRFASLYSSLGGAKVLGDPVTGMAMQNGNPVQFFRYGELAMNNGVAKVVPVGDAMLRLKGWLPLKRASDVFPDDMADSVVASIHSGVRSQAPGMEPAERAKRS